MKSSTEIATLLQQKRQEARISKQKADEAGSADQPGAAKPASMAENGGFAEFKSTWDPNGGAEQSMNASGSFDPNSSFAKQYNALEEDTGSRVDDEEGWRQIKRDDPPKNAAEYEAFVKKWSAAGFDVKAIDMDGDNFTHSNIAIKPKGKTTDSGGDEPMIAQSPEMSEAKAYTRAMFDYRNSGDDMQSVTGYNPVTGEYGFNKPNGQTAASTFNDKYKANLKYELKLKPQRPVSVDQANQVYRGGPDDQQDDQAYMPQ